MPCSVTKLGFRRRETSPWTRESWLEYMPWWVWVRQRHGKWYKECWPQHRSWTPNLRRLESKATKSYRDWHTTYQQAPNMATKYLKALANAQCSPAKLSLFFVPTSNQQDIYGAWPKATEPTIGPRCWECAKDSKWLRAKILGNLRNCRLWLWHPRWSSHVKWHVEF